VARVKSSFSVSSGSNPSERGMTDKMHFLTLALLKLRSAVHIDRTFKIFQIRHTGAMMHSQHDKFTVLWERIAPDHSLNCCQPILAQTSQG